MSGQLDHSPARIIRELLIDLSSGTSDLSADWAIFVNSIPDDPDKVIVINDTTGVLDGRIMITGEQLTEHGFQVVIRDQGQDTGFVRANLIATTLDIVLRSSVTIGSSTYLVQAVSRVGDVIYVGTDVPQSNLHLFTINARTSLCKT